ncbi:uncharacterized protein LOC124701998 [Lolium rigidum]|uniref:uncharacterized protein LOC124701998 n=1 Tax=Lolium rigidum TaxID=89674 RepID=UPI001F5D13B7|nr:uncharacterized protein LOC124701998 [Lolium rigidum]XP_047090061.1 uncharacterized protein LOC124701998 [Lolium rigidum]
MSSSRRNPFHDITNGLSQDTKEVKRRRERDRYANNKDEILKRRRHLRDLKKESMDAANVENIPSHTQANVGNSGIIQYMPSQGMPIDVQHNASHVGGDDDSDWFHRNDAYQVQPKPGGTTHILIAQSNNVATGSVVQLSGDDDLVRCDEGAGQGDASPRKVKVVWCSCLRRAMRGCIH